MKRLFAVALTFLTLFMVGSTIIALVQDDLDMGWWWVVPISGVFVLLLVVFRVAVQLSAEAAARADRELDEAEAREAAEYERGGRRDH